MGMQNKCHKCVGRRLKTRSRENESNRALNSIEEKLRDVLLGR